MDNKQTSRPTCLVTGGSSGIGLATAILFSQQGYDISICGRGQAKLKKAKRLIRAANGEIECLTIKADLIDIRQSEMVAEQTVESFGRIDVLVNNAAVSPLAPFEEITREMFESTINTNIRSLFYLTQQAWKKMKQQESGVIVNISSLSAVDPFPGFSLYGACKAWLDLLTHALAAEGSDQGIRVCSIRPGAVETPMLRRLFPEFPADQCVQPADVAQAVWQCVNDAQNYPSGQAFTIAKQ